MATGTSDATATPEVADSGWFGDSLFKEIGHTLESVGNEVLTNGFTSIRTTIARRLQPDPAPQAGLAAYLPMIIMVLVGFLVFRRLAR